MRVAILSGVLFLSGVGALIFETLWLRLSGLAFGNSVWAAALILSSFMAGLALGNAIAASSRVLRWRPVRLYALLEFAVAVFGCTIVFGLPLMGEWLRPMWQTLWNYQPALISLRFVFSFLILLVPTTAMGLTLPVLMADPLSQRTEFSRAIGFLYGCNTLGAVVGALVGEGFLVTAFGLRGTSLAAASASSIAATIALLAAKRDGQSGAAAPHSKTLTLRFDARYSPPWRLLFVSFGTGFLFLALEVIWFRFLRLYVASSPIAFAVMLAVVLAGIGLGSLGWGAFHRRASDRLLPILLLLAAITALLCYLLFPGELIKPGSGAFNVAAWPQIALLSIALMLPVALLSGAVFPAIVARVQAAIGDRMNSTGVTTLFNTAGAALGPLVASFVLLPALGYQTSLIACAAAYGLLAIISSEREQWGLRGPLALSTATLSVALVLIIVFFPYRRVQVHFAHASRPHERDEHGRVLAHVVKRVEGTADTLQLLERDLFGEPYYYRLLTNAFSMSATNPHSQRYMRLFAYLPLAFRPVSEDVLVLCYGCGVTADAFLHGPHVKRMDVVDISKEVFALADFYAGINYSNPLRDPRAQTIVQDARFFLQACPKKYDIISGEPPPPKVAGSVNLYTEEFFRLMKSRLKEGGLATFWLPINQLKLEEAKAILRAFHNAFANASVWAGPDQEWIMMGINGPGAKVTEDEIAVLWNDAASGPDLRRIGMEVPQQLGALFLMDGREIDRVTRDVAALTDNYPKRLTEEQWDEEANHRFVVSYMDPPRALQRFSGSSLIKAIWPDMLDRSLEALFAVRASRYLSETVGGNELAELDLYLRYSRLHEPVLATLGSDSFRVAIAERVASKSNPPPLETLPDLIAGALAARELSRAIALLEAERDRGVNDTGHLLLLIYVHCLNGAVDKAEALAAANTSAIPKDSLVDWLWQKLQTDFGFRPPD
jgi:spermidine synthase